MTAGKKLTIVLAIAIPLLTLGGGLVLAAGDETDVVPGSVYADAAYAATPISAVTNVAYDCDECPGLCQGNGEPCDGECTGAGDCDGQCAGSGACPRFAQGNEGYCGGNCYSEQTAGAGRSYRGGCGGRWTATESGSAPACPSCDVVGLNFEQPILATRA